MVNDMIGIKNPIGIFNTQTLKIIACISMLIDHIGYTFFGQIALFRIIGRLAFPIFAFFIAEGSRYTRNPAKRLATILVIGAACDIVYYISTGVREMNILLTFSFSIIIIYCLDWAKERLFDEHTRTFDKIISVLFVSAVIYIFDIVTDYISIDYGFAGIMTPVLISLFDVHAVENAPMRLKKIDCLAVRIICLCVGLLWIYLELDWNILIYSFAAVPLLCLYNGQLGNRRLKYGFYIFYPLHLAVIAGIDFIMKL